MAEVLGEWIVTGHHSLSFGCAPVRSRSRPLAQSSTVKRFLIATASHCAPARRACAALCGAMRAAHTPLPLNLRATARPLRRPANAVEHFARVEKLDRHFR